MSFNTILFTKQNKDDLESDVKIISPFELYGREFDIPPSFDGRIAWANYLPPVQDQGMCGSGYSFAWATVLSTRFGLLSGGHLIVNLTAVDAVICPLPVPGEDLSLSVYGKDLHEALAMRKYRLEQERIAHELRACHGDTLVNAAKFLYLIGSATTSCIPNSLITTGIDLPTCEDVEDPTHTLSFNGCYKSKKAQRTFRLQNVYRLDIDSIDTRDLNIMYELAKFGPITAGMFIYDDFFDFDPIKEIYTHSAQTSERLGGHSVVIIGWGEENGIKYWILRNSWGPKWGDNGHFRMQRWISDCELENNIISGTPELLNTLHLDLPTFPDILVRQRNTFQLDLKTYYARDTEHLIYTGVLEGNLDHLFEANQLPKLGRGFSVLNPSIPTHSKLLSVISPNSSSSNKIVVYGVICVIGLILILVFMYMRGR